MKPASGERKRGRPTGKNRTPLSNVERRARNAEYERQRRAEQAQAMALLAEAVGCDPNVASLEILEDAARTIKSLRNSNGNLLREKREYQQKLAAYKLAIKNIGVVRMDGISTDTGKTGVDGPEPLPSTFPEANLNTIHHEVEIKTSPVYNLTDSESSPWFQLASSESTPEYKLASYENSPDYKLEKTEDSPKYHLPANQVSPEYHFPASQVPSGFHFPANQVPLSFHLPASQVSPGYKFVPSENTPEYRFGASSISAGYQLASIVNPSNGLVTTNSSPGMQLVEGQNLSGQYPPLPQDISDSTSAEASSIVDWSMFESGADLLAGDFNVEADFQWSTDNCLSDILHY